MSATLITDFYSAFASGDAAGMTSCYHDDITFSDPAFGTLHADRAKAMWLMLLSAPGANLRVAHANVLSDGQHGSASWTAHYTYGPARRFVTNHVTARFTFADGKILTHHDHFDLWRWSRQALGATGWLLGWSPLMRRKVQATTAARLDRYLAQA